MSSDLQETLGPYQVNRRLGSGGMGEVFLAYDPRLDRQVAIKRIRPDAGVESERRSRFQREARVAAGLLHPAIVQVFDLLTLEDVDHIVMEYVPGTSLRRALEAGPLPLAEGLRVACAVAGGLAYAHGKGVVHRDLKSENVLIGPEGEVKIADFGIARRLQVGGESTGETLTREGAVMGTYRAMSPEQACGDPLDARTDLFSLGVLLYETFTGESPFLADSNARTIERLFNYRPPPVRERAAGVPPSLSDLIDHLLEKQPDLRPRDAVEVAERLSAIQGTVELEGQATRTLGVEHRSTLTAATRAAPAASDSGTYGGARRRGWIAAVVTVAIAIAVALGVALRPEPQLLYAAVLKPEVQGTIASDATDRLALAIRNALLHTLVSLEGISPKTPEEVDGVAGPPTAIARTVAADELIAARLACQARSCSVMLRRISGEDGTVVWDESQEVPVDEPLKAARALASLLRRGYPEQDLRRGLEIRTTPEDYAVYLEILEKQHDEADLSELLDMLARVRERSQDFLDVYLLEADIAVRRFYETRDGAMLTRALDVVAKAEALAPGDPEVLFQRVYVEILGGHLDRAEATLTQLDELVPGDVRILNRRGHLLEERGELARALELYRDAMERRPYWRWLFNAARAARRQGEMAIARDSLEELIARFPGHYEGLSVLAQLELTGGDLRRSVKLYESLVARFPAAVEINNLGLAYMLLDEHAASAQAFEQAATLAPRNPIYLANLADAYWLENRGQKASELYSQVLDILDEQPNAGGWWSLTLRAQALAHLGDHRQAVSLAQQALQQAPEESEVVFAAALVYAVVGDRTAAIVNVERAIELGYQVRWFELPWFAELRTDPEFVRLISGSSTGSP